MAGKKPQSQSKTKTSAQESRPSRPRLLGKVALVTGGSRGIGFAIARTLAAEGCSVVITGRDGAKLARSGAELRRFLPKKSHAHNDSVVEVVVEVCDVRNPDSVASLFAMVKQHFGKLDVLVNNAGIAQPAVSIEQTSREVWRDVIDTNLTGLFLCTRAALPLMQAGATVINNLSVAARTVFPNFAAYNASKHGALGFTLSLRDELIPRGIRVVALMPGATDTDLWQQFWPDAPRERMVDVKSVAQAALYAVLLPPTVNLSEVVLAPTGGAL